jgi:hypothetical protein
MIFLLQVITRQGDIDATCYLLMQGELAVHLDSADDPSLPTLEIRRLLVSDDHFKCQSISDPICVGQPGAFFGENGLMRPVARDTTILVVDTLQEPSAQSTSGSGGSAVVMRLRKSTFQHLLRRFERTVQSNVQVYKSYNEANKMLLGTIRQRILRASDRDTYVGVLQRYQNAVGMLPLQCDHAYITRRARQVDYAQAKKDLMRESSVLLNGVRRTLHSQRSYCTFLRVLYALADAAFAVQQEQKNLERASPKQETQNRREGAPPTTGAGLTPVHLQPPPSELPRTPPAPTTFHSLPQTRTRSRSDTSSYSPRGTNVVCNVQRVTWYVTCNVCNVVCNAQRVTWYVTCNVVCCMLVCCALECYY